MENFLDNEKLGVIKAFSREWVRLSSPQSILYLNKTQHPILPLLDQTKTKSFYSSNEIDTDLKFPLIFGDLPLGMKTIKVEFNRNNYLLQLNWWEIFESLLHLEENGIGLFIIEPIEFSTKIGQSFKQILQESGFYINAYFNTPEYILKPLTTITPIIIVISRKEKEKIFVAELLDEIQAQRLVNSYFDSINSNNLAEGMFLESLIFEGFNKLKIDQQFLHLTKQYDNYSKQNLGELAISIKLGNRNTKFEDLHNCIYIPKIGNSPVASNLQDLKIKQQNYFQVQLDESVENAYVSEFLNTKLGKLSRETATAYTTIPHLNRSRIEFIPIFFPQPEEQHAIITTKDLLARLKITIDEFNEELSLNPKSAISIQEQLIPMLEAIDKLTDIDRIQALIRKGETKNVEFKETLSLNVRNQSKDKHIETSALKTIVAFLNTDGGTLILGVNDSGDITGINIEINKLYKSIDKFKLHLTNLIRDHIGSDIFHFVNYEVIKFNESYICKVECTPSKQPCYLDKSDFYIRTNPASQLLTGIDVINYVNTRFFNFREKE